MDQLLGIGIENNILDRELCLPRNCSLCAFGTVNPLHVLALALIESHLLRSKNKIMDATAKLH